MYSVVIIDDNKIAVEAISKSTDWEKCGCRVAGTAYDGIAGLELIHDAAPDIVIIDIQMPGFNGLDVIKKIKGARKDVQFIIISGYSQFEYAQQAIRYGVCDYLLKPIMTEEMEQALIHVADTLRKIEAESMPARMDRRGFTQSAPAYQVTNPWYPRQSAMWAGISTAISRLVMCATSCWFPCHTSVNVSKRRQEQVFPPMSPC